MRKHVKVIRSANQTVVIYRDEPIKKAAVSVPVTRAKAVPVFCMGKFLFYILPSGRIHYPRRYFLGFLPIPRVAF